MLHTYPVSRVGAAHIGSGRKQSVAGLVQRE
jgi:hypothetical protein